jgi:hypothetical protein
MAVRQITSNIDIRDTIKDEVGTGSLGSQSRSSGHFVPDGETDGTHRLPR